MRMDRNEYKHLSLPHGDTVFHFAQKSRGNPIETLFVPTEGSKYSLKQYNKCCFCKGNSTETEILLLEKRT